MTSEARTDRWLALVTAVERLSAAESMAEVIQVVRETARTISGADGVTFVLRDGDLCHYVEENAVGPLWKGRRFPLTACISGWCMLNRRMAVIPDIYLDPRIPHDAYRPTFVKSLVMTPVRAEDPLAAIGAYWSACREFSEGEVALLEGLGRSTAAAIAAVQARASLRESEARLAHALEAGNLGAWEINLATGELAASQLCRNTFGWAPGARLTAEAFTAGLEQPEGRRLAKALARAGSEHLDLSLEVRVPRPEGLRWIEIRGRVQRDVNGDAARIAGVCADVTESRLAKERIDALQAELVRVGRIAELDHMSSALAHELSQPLSAANSYLGAARHLLDGEAPSLASVQAFVAKAEAQLTRIAQIIQRIRGFIGKAESTVAAEEVGGLLAEAAEIALMGPAAKGAELRLDIDADLPLVLVDKVQIQQVVLNLLRNAFEAMDGGVRRVTVSARPAEVDGMLEIRVEDSGPGLAPEVASRLFEPFVTTKAGGMGVGLSICQRIVATHGGAMRAEQAKAGGAAFCFTLPRTPAAGLAEVGAGLSAGAVA